MSASGSLGRHPAGRHPRVDAPWVDTPWVDTPLSTACWDTPPPCGQTDPCENITFLQVLLRAVTRAKEPMSSDHAIKTSIKLRAVVVHRMLLNTAVSAQPLHCSVYSTKNKPQTKNKTSQHVFDKAAVSVCCLCTTSGSPMQPIGKKG